MEYIILSHRNIHMGKKESSRTKLIPVGILLASKLLVPQTHTRRMRPMDLSKFIQITIKPYSLKLRSSLTFLQVFIV